MNYLYANPLAWCPLAAEPSRLHPVDHLQQEHQGNTTGQVIGMRAQAAKPHQSNHQKIE